MKYDLAEFEKRVEAKLIRKVETDKLVLYNYTDQCAYDKAWDEYTLAARGIIFEKSTGKLIAKPFNKFFNLGEREETNLLNLPDLPYTVTEKMDGSLGIIYYYDGKWNVATRGSFNSEQAQKGLELLNTKYKTNILNTNVTYLVEIIYPENKIVVNYGDEQKLVLLGAFFETTIHSHQECNLDGMYMKAARLVFDTPMRYNLTIMEMIELKKTLPKDEEGFVVRFENGLRVKIKGDEYLKIHKMISEMSPLSFWESMKNGEVDKNYLVQLPEEFRNDFEPIVDSLESAYVTVKDEVLTDVLNLPIKYKPEGLSKEELKTLGLLTQSENSGLKHPGAMFPFMLQKREAVDRYIMKTIKPTGNVLKFG